MPTPSRRTVPCDAVLTNGRNRIAYNILRSLGKAGLRVAYGTDAEGGMGEYSRFAQATFRHPSHSSDEQQFVEAVRQKILQYEPRVYLPTSEEIFAVARHLDRFTDLGVRIPISPHSILERLENKQSANELARALGLAVPASITPGSREEIHRFARHHGYPVVLKKCHSSSALDVHFLRKDMSERDLAALISADGWQAGQYLVQAWVQGETYGVSLLMNHGETRARFVHRRLREMHFSGGPSTTRISARHPVIEAQAERLLAAVKFHGVAMVEFRCDPATNQAWFIEVNPRFWGSVGLAINAGMDFPRLLFQLAVAGDIEPTFDYRMNYRCRWLLGEMAGIASEIKATGRLAPALDLFRLPDGYDDFYADDPLPFLAGLVAQPWHKFRRRNPR